MSKENFEKTLGFFAEGGAIPRGLASDLIHQYDWAQAELNKEPQPSPEAAAVIEDARAKGIDLGSLSFLQGELTVDRSNETIASPDHEPAKAKKSK